MRELIVYRRRLVPASIKPGYKPSARLLERIRRQHPRILVMWDDEAADWVAVERTLDGDYRLLWQYQGEWPTEENTLEPLNTMELRMAAQTESEIAAVEEAIDAPGKKVQDEIYNRGREKLMEGHERLWYYLGPSLHVSFNGTRKNRP